MKSLSKVSEVDTKDIRRDIHKANRSKNSNRSKHHLENDKLLKEEGYTGLGEIPSKGKKKMFEDRCRSNCLKEKQIES